MATSAYARRCRESFDSRGPGGFLQQELSSVRAATAHGITQKEFWARHCRDPQEKCDTLVELGESAAFVACGRAAAMTGMVANLTGGEIVD